MINNLNDEKIIGTFHEKELQKTNQEEFWIEKNLEKEARYMSNGKDIRIHSMHVLLYKKNIFCLSLNARN